jgi:hypothetical protein
MTVTFFTNLLHRNEKNNKLLFYVRPLVGKTSRGRVASSKKILKRPNLAISSFFEVRFLEYKNGQIILFLATRFKKGQMATMVTGGDCDFFPSKNRSVFF